ncbi:MAG TPA: response regulator [Planctomycetota bacterium]|nr:response regulator [Planctomycetota bacterium]
MLPEQPLILVVDDESDSLAYLFDLLHNEGYRVLPTPSALEALAQIAKRKPQLVISDLRMPDLDGLELLDRVKRDSPQTRVLLLTAYGTRAMSEDVLRRGGEAMLIKPSTSGEILRAVRRALEGAGAIPEPNGRGDR